MVLGSRGGCAIAAVAAALLGGAGGAAADPWAEWSVEREPATPVLLARAQRTDAVRAELDAGYRLELGTGRHLELRYRGGLTERAADRGQQRHAPAVALSQELPGGLDAELGWEWRTRWEELELDEAELLGRGFARLRLTDGGAWGRTDLRYEFARPQVGEGPDGRHRAVLTHVLPLGLGSGAELELVPRLEARLTEGAQAERSLRTGLGARVETDAGLGLSADMAWEPSPGEGGALRAGARLDTPVSEGLGLYLDVGWCAEEVPGRRETSLRAGTGLELRF